MEISEVYTRPGTNLMQQTMIELYDKGLFCDIRLNVGGTVFSTHKPVLYLNSPVLRNMLTKETSDKYKEELNLNDVDPDDFKLILTYMYTGLISIDGANIMRVLKVSDYLEMTGIVKFCLSLLEQFLNKDNALELFQYSHIFGGSDMRRKSRKMIFDNLPSFQSQLNDCALSDVEGILFEPFENNSWIKTHSVAVYHSTMQWIRHDIDQREQHYEALISRFDFGDFSGKFLKVVLSDEIFLRHSQLHGRVFAELSEKIGSMEEGTRKQSKNEAAEGSLQFTFSDLTNLESNEVAVGGCVLYIRGKPWELAVEKTEDELGRSWLSVFACFNRGDTTGGSSCDAIVRFSLLPYGVLVDKFTQEMTRVETFDSMNRWGVVKFILWDKAFSLYNGIVSPQGKLTLAMHVDTRPRSSNDCGTPNTTQASPNSSSSPNIQTSPSIYSSVPPSPALPHQRRNRHARHDQQNYTSFCSNNTFLLFSLSNN